jgi:hypothetical protein
MGNIWEARLEAGVDCVGGGAADDVEPPEGTRGDGGTELRSGAIVYVRFRDGVRECDGEVCGYGGCLMAAAQCRSQLPAPGDGEGFLKRRSEHARLYGGLVVFIVFVVSGFPPFHKAL